jgi:heptosyltransferase-2
MTARMTSRTTSRPASQPASLVVQTSFLGDTVLTTPLIEELARRGPVDVVARPDAATLLAGHPAIRDVVVFDKRGRDRGRRGLAALVERLRTRADGSPRPIAAAYLAQSSLRSALIPRMLGVPRRIGWATSLPGRLLYTTRVEVPAGIHFAERAWRLAFEGREPTGPMPLPSLAPSTGDEGAVDAMLRGALEAGDVRPLVVLAPGSVWATKRWPYFGALVRKYGHAFRFAVIGGPADRSLAEEIAHEGGRLLDATGHLSLLGSAALIRRAAAIVTNDSVALHLASAMNTPTVAIFGPTVPAFGFGPLASASRILQRDELTCRPCHHHGPPTCPLGHHKCMRDLLPESVSDALVELLDGDRPPGRRLPLVPRQRAPDAGDA